MEYFVQLHYQFSHFLDFNVWIWWFRKGWDLEDVEVDLSRFDFKVFGFLELFLLFEFFGGDIKLLLSLWSFHWLVFFLLQGWYVNLNRLMHLQIGLFLCRLSLLLGRAYS